MKRATATWYVSTHPHNHTRPHKQAHANRYKCQILVYQSKKKKAKENPFRTKFSAKTKIMKSTT